MSTFGKGLAQFLSGVRDSLCGVYKFMQRQYALASRLSNSETTSAASRAPKPALTTNTKVLATTKSTLAKSNEKLLQRLFQSCILNGIFLLLCILVFNYVLIPILNYIVYKVISERNHGLIADYLNPSIQFLFSFVWILPVFLLSKIFNVLCHQEIADIAYQHKYGKPRTYQKFTVAQVIADTVFSCTMELIFLMQSSLMTLVPASMLNTILGHVHLAFLYSLYAFEYKFCNMGWDIRQRIHHIESRWPYYLGFGLSLSLILSLASSYIINATLFATLFPAFILSSIESDSERLASIKYTRHATDTGLDQEVPLTVPLFKLAIYLTDLLFKLFTSKTKLANNTNVKAKSSVPVLNIRKTN